MTHDVFRGEGNFLILSVHPQDLEGSVQELLHWPSFFGYNRLVNDMSAISAMKNLGYPVVFDATHSTQQPGGLGTASAGKREMAPILARAAVAAGANGLFLEIHTEPEKAKSDAACIMPIDWLEDVMKICKEIHGIVHS